MIEFYSFGYEAAAVEYIDELAAQLHGELGIELVNGISQDAENFLDRPIHNGIKSHQVSDNYGTIHEVRIQIQKSMGVLQYYDHFIHTLVEKDGRKWFGHVRLDDGRIVKTLIFGRHDSIKEIRDYFLEFPRNAQVKNGN